MQNPCSVDWSKEHRPMLHEVHKFQLLSMVVVVSQVLVILCDPLRRTI